MKRIRFAANTEKELATMMERESRKIRVQLGGGNWKLDQAMRAKGLSDHSLGRACGVTWMCVYYWRHGARFPTPPNMEALTKALGMTAEELGFGKKKGGVK